MAASRPAQWFSDTNPVRVFRIYNHYRMVISLILIGSLFAFEDTSKVGFRNLDLYQYSIFAYGGINLFTGMLLLAGIRPRIPQISISLYIDLIILHLLMLFSTGISSGMANLVVIAVGAGNILIRGVMGVLLAASAAIFTLLITLYPIFYLNEDARAVIQAGMLGIIYFVAAFILQNITRRIISSEALAQQRAKDVEELESLNHQIIQRMQTGIIVCNEFGNIRLLNQAAILLAFPPQTADERPRVLPHALQERLDQWRLHSDIRLPPFKPDSARPPVQASFTRLEKKSGHDIIIFVEDTSKIAQQAQQLKLASLGRLTAGIAHEIRNPLGAISHAAQLLAESRHLDKADIKMTEIILRHANRVNSIVENILQLSRRKEPETEVVDLANWIKDFVDTYTAGGTLQCKITIIPPLEPAYARFDLSQLEQIVTNLVDNGLRYSEKQTGQPVLTLRIGTLESSGRAYLEIIDRGPGIPSEAEDHIFEPFFTTESNGTGLGLYLSRELCEANQAQLDYINSKEQGCTFRITFAHHKRIA